jgi:peptide/nickel transport system substrate-binding protein
VFRSSTTRRALVGITLGGCLITAACAAPKPASSTGSSPSAPAAASGQARAGGTLVAAQPVDATPSSFLSPAFGNILTQYSVFQTLTLENPTSGVPTPVLATSWTIAPNGLSMTINLRHGVTFHSGRTFTSADVVFTLHQMQNPAVSTQGAELADNIASIKAHGAYQVDLTFKRPMPNIFDLFDIMPIVNKDTYSQLTSGKDVDGTGPFVWKSWTPGAEIVLQRYPKYWDAKAIHLNAIDIDIITNPTAELAAVQSGRVQFALGLDAIDATTQGRKPGYALVETSGAEFPLCFTVTDAPFNNKLAREAVNYAIDRQRIVQQVDSGIGLAGDLPWKPATPGYNKALASLYTYSPAKAKQLLAQAGVKTGTTFNMVILDTPQVTEMAQIVQSNLAAVGLNVTLQALPDAQFNARLAADNMGAPAVMWQSSQAFSPATQVEITQQLRPTDNIEHFQTAQYTQLVSALTSAVTASQQIKALSNYDTYFVNQAECAPLVSDPTVSVSTTGVGGIVGTDYGFINLSEAYLTK